ncbi:TadG family pilus assembly protein [Ralstonia solanacearum]|uniref:TadG family pilus assembly protein n=1 Tax=Ralstonia solanacearum TaxID=305 RepID=UPI000181717D|nr:TadG family pilus assembly protein [Ralstonia solanacearum]MDC6178717.1 TadG family pilus assembly protein [Ralstonia solanacearum]MDC6211345.1 TadG family pilus assembly protein [Ralstonia solanacearum]MDC6240210.1 TadG family pilus assembly protein [Ralstonia solanacearum]MDD7801867.1 TadG family pilus assembly protein [Ralstonia solanacearum]
MVSVLTAVFVATVGLTLLVSVDIGNVFFTQRALQRAADMAAMAAAQRLDIPTQAAQQSVAQNGLTITPTVVLGVWNATNTAAAPTYFCASGNAGCSGTVNAAQVTLTQNVPYFFSVGQRTLTATAIAKNTAIVSFSLGSGLASVNGGLLNQMLGALLGNSNPLSLDLVSYQGLANTTIRVSDLMAALNVGTVQQLVSSQVSLSQLVSAVVSAGGQNGLTGVSVGTVLAPNTLVIGPLLRSTLINVGNSTGTPGVLQFLAQAGNDQSALNAQLNVLDLVTTAAQIANNQNAATISTNLALPGVVGLPGPVNVGLTLKIIQPPVIAIGPPGTDASGNWQTTAKTGQVSLGLNVTTSVVGIINMTIPIGLIAAGANAHLEAAHCPVPRSGLSADFGGQVTPVSLCIASGSATAVSNVSSYACPTTPAPLVQASVLGVTTTLADLWATIAPQAASGWTPDPTTVTVGQTARVSGTSNFFGSILNSSLSQVQLRVLNSAVLSTLGINQTLLASTIGLVGQTLDAVLTPLLRAIGIQLGYADIKVLSVNCDAVELVF